MANSWKIIDASRDDILIVTFTINGVDYTQELFKYWEGTDSNGQPASGGIRVDNADNASTDLNAYMADYAQGIHAAFDDTPAPDPLNGLTGGKSADW